MPAIADQIAANYGAVMQRIESACERAGRHTSSVSLVAVTKYARLEWVRSLVELGVGHLGESRPQQLEERVPRLPDTVNWHLIGHLQRNKVRRVLSLVDTIQSVDSLRLLERIDNIAGELGLRPTVLLEVNVSGEEAKDGFAPGDLVEQWKQVLEFKHAELRGLMTMAPLTDDVEQARPVFRGLRELRDRLKDASPGSTELPDLSMGMSRDFEIAIEEGATMIRVGSDLFAGLEEAEE